MYSLIGEKLKRRENPLQVAVVGAGWFGGGVIRCLYAIEGICPKVIINRSTAKVVSLLRSLGIAPENIKHVKDFREEDTKSYFLSSDLEDLTKVKEIDVVFEATGDILAGAKAFFYAMERSLPFVTANVEMDSTIGFFLASYAEERQNIYAVCDGDQPGCLARMIPQLEAWGFSPKVVGNCKGFYNPFQTPEKVAPHLSKGQDLLKACSFADGSKQSMELTTVANAYGYSISKRGMHGPRVTKEKIVSGFDALLDLSSLEIPCVDYVMGVEGIDQGGGVFVVAEGNDFLVPADMSYLKKGEGPFYLFFRDYHLCYFEAFSTIAEVFLFHHSPLRAKGIYVETVALAKRDLTAGTALGEIGGENHYGLVETVEVVQEENLFPQGLAPYGTICKNVFKAAPLTWDDVELQENLVTACYEKQKCLEVK